MSLDTGSANTAPSTTVVGFYNNPVSGDVFQVGAGTSTNRRNAFRVLQDGRARVFSKATENGDILRFGDLEVKQVSSLDSDVTSTTGDYITGVKFNGNTLKFTKGSSTITVNDNGKGDIITGIEGNNGHTLTITRKNIPDVSVNSSGTGAFVVGISSDGHGITYTKGNLKSAGGPTRPVWVNDGDITNCSFSISAKDNRNAVLTDANIIFYVGA